MVYIPIHDHDFFRRMPALEMPSADRHRVEQTKTHCSIAQGVMARRSHQRDAVGVLPGRDRIEQIQKPANGEQRNAKRVPAGNGVAVECVMVDC